MMARHVFLTCALCAVLDVFSLCVPLPPNALFVYVVHLASLFPVLCLFIEAVRGATTYFLSLIYYNITFSKVKKQN